MTRLRALVLVLLLGATLGCEDEPTPDIADPTTSVTSSPSQSESTPAPEALTPEETVRAWVDAWNEALRTGDTGTLESLALPDCRNCSNYVSTIEDVVTAGGSFSGGEWTVVELSTQEQGTDKSKVVVGMAVAAGATVNAAGEEPVPYEAEKRGVVYQLTRSDDSWLIDAIDLLS